MKKQSQIESVIANKVKQFLKMKLKLNRLLRHSSLISRNEKLKKIFSIIMLLFSLVIFGQEIEYREYSYTEFFNLIENTQDTIVRLNNIIVKPNPSTDQDFTAEFSNELKLGEDFLKPLTSTKKTITKELDLRNIEFQAFKLLENFNSRTTKAYGLFNVIFKKPVSIRNAIHLVMAESETQEGFKYIRDAEFKKHYETINPALSLSVFMVRNRFKKKFSIGVYDNEEGPYGHFFLDRNLIEIKPDASLFDARIVFGKSNTSINFQGNVISGEDFKMIFSIKKVSLTNNEFNSDATTFRYSSNEGVIDLVNNKVSGIARFRIKPLSPVLHNIDWEQFENKIFDDDAARDWAAAAQLGYAKYSEQRASGKGLGFFRAYEKDLIQNTSEFRRHMNFLGSFNTYYRERHNTESANQVYIQLKNIETQRLAYLHQQNPSFKTFFKWRINQFLKVFSAYGTEPERAVIFSMYVIFLFAFIYLLFPNSWDAHGRKRIMNRYAFFFTYMNKKSGIHEVYLDNQKEDLLEFDEFKMLVEKQGKTVPKFFTTTALPLYKWAISGTKMSASFLSKIDIMKGTWQELPKHQRIWKAALLIGAFIIAIVYDIFIKVLNALMLSINTFTTLGFGEIPIKGLPRYLAIIQGFIGWFMLTIFSVSLISQLLN